MGGRLKAMAGVEGPRRATDESCPNCELWAGPISGAEPPVGHTAAQGPPSHQGAAKPALGLWVVLSASTPHGLGSPRAGASPLTWRRLTRDPGEVRL